MLYLLFLLLFSSFSPIRLNSRKESGLLKRTGMFLLLLLTGITIQGRHLGRFLSPSLLVLWITMQCVPHRVWIPAG